MLERFEALPQIVVASSSASEHSAVGVTVEGVPVELVVAEPERFGTELVRATGSPDVRRVARSRCPRRADEAGVYARARRAVVPARAARASASRRAAAARRAREIRGDLHCHTTWSDGKASVLEMGDAPRATLGYEYVAICDHTPNVRVVPGLDADALRRQGEEIAAVNERLAPFRVLRGIECDILPDGTLDLPDDVLAELDWVQLSLHAGQRAAGDRADARRSSRRCGTRRFAASATRRAGSSTTARRMRSTSSV